MSTAAIPVKDEFRNDSGGQQGVVIIDGDGKAKGIAVAPGDTIWLSQDEQILTANAPKKEEDNPLVNGALTLVSEAGEVINRRPLRPGEVLGKGELPEAASVEELAESSTVSVETPEAKEVATPVAAEIETASDAPATEGTRAENEETATPPEQVESIETLEHQGQPVRRARKKSEE